MGHGEPAGEDQGDPGGEQRPAPAGDQRPARHAGASAGPAMVHGPVSPCASGDHRAGKRPSGGTGPPGPGGPGSGRDRIYQPPPILRADRTGSDRHSGRETLPFGCPLSGRDPHHFGYGWRRNVRKPEKRPQRPGGPG